ncbi:bestrophin-like domain [Streptomyces melanogenes]|uniref:bestrophin-like domain n=1 Tax=Streptomyces melanogenes TaxID=67326 RepID=UPI0037906C2E
MSQWLVLLAALVLVCAVVLSVTVLRHRRVADAEDPSETPDVIEYMVMMVGVVYAIVLGLAIAGVWEARGAAEDSVQREAQALYEVGQRVDVYPPAVRDRIRNEIGAYAAHTVSAEWPLLVQGQEPSADGAALLAAVRTDVTHRAPANDLQAQAYQPLLDQIATADDARHARLDSAGSTLPGVVWFGLVAGAVVTIGLIFTLQIRRSARELLLAGIFSGLIVFLLFLVWSFDAPFGRSGTESADPFRELVPSVTAAQAAHPTN